jgi:ubiquinone/menaquinone biosynthesis C-methylase UbiE
MGDSDRGQVTASAAEIYDAFFVPALFGQFTEAVLDVAAVAPGQRVLDIGCGTGVLARAARDRVGPAGRVVAVDPNDGMLDVARRASAEIDWKAGVAEELPAPDASFDRSISQFALMFFTDTAAAFAEIARVTRPDGRVALAVWDQLESNTGYARLADLLERLFGPRAAQALQTPFRLGDASTLAEIAAGDIADPRVTSHRGTARFESLDAWLHTEIRGWTLADEIDDDGYKALLDAAGHELTDLVIDDAVAFEVSALIVSGAPRCETRPRA